MCPVPLKQHPKQEFEGFGTKMEESRAVKEPAPAGFNKTKINN